MRNRYEKNLDPYPNALERGELQITSPQSFERCSFCGSKILFSHQLNLEFIEVIELGRCPTCGVTTEPKSFRIH